MSSFLVDILSDFLGEIRNHNESTHQVSYDCPSCSDEKGINGGDGKGNLEINYEKGVFKCWCCKDTNNMSGYIPKLIRRYGKPKHIKQYQILKPDYKQSEYQVLEHIKQNPVLPESFTLLTGYKGKDKAYKDAMKYLRERNITDDIIKKYNLGFTTKGRYFLRIIIPSYNIDNELNFFSGRSFSWVKPKYMNFEENKQDIIFNERLINWESTIYLVEGPFDHIVTPNSIPLLGKYIYPLLYDTIIEKAKGNIVIVLDPDAEKDAENVYRELFYSPVCQQVRMVILPEGYDISDIHRMDGKKGVIKLLRTAKKLIRFKYLN